MKAGLHVTSYANALLRGLRCRSDTPRFALPRCCVRALRRRSASVRELYELFQAVEGSFSRAVRVAPLVQVARILHVPPCREVAPAPIELHRGGLHWRSTKLASVTVLWPNARPELRLQSATNGRPELRLCNKRMHSELPGSKAA